MRTSFLRRYGYFGLLAAALQMMVLITCAPALYGTENTCPYSGYLWGTGARSSFEVYSDSGELQVFFTWPSGASDFRVKVTDNDGTEVLADQSLNEGDLFTLTGSGIFHFEIYSKWGSGCWKATVKKIK
jgi:hypothetical protein